MRDNDETMTAEEFFDEIEKTERVYAKSCQKRRKTEADGLFNEIKTKMVMRINGVSRAKALEIIAARVKKSEDRAKKSACDDNDLMSAEDFFRS